MAEVTFEQLLRAVQDRVVPTPGRDDVRKLAKALGIEVPTLPHANFTNDGEVAQYDEFIDIYFPKGDVFDIDHASAVISQRGGPSVYEHYREHSHAKLIVRLYPREAKALVAALESVINRFQED